MNPNGSNSIRKFHLLLFLGIGVLLIGTSLNFVYPTEMGRMPIGFYQPILAFEFIESSEEVMLLFGQEEEQREKWIDEMELGHYVDYVFLIFYSLFICSWAWYYKRTYSHNILYFVMGLAVIAGFSDIIENTQLSIIANNLDIRSIQHHIDVLQLFTWIKWASLTMALLALAPYVVKEKWIGSLYALTSVLTLVLAVIAFNQRSMITSLFILGLFIQFLILIVLAVRMNIRSIAKKRS